ncbi:MAG: Undecaprenyl-diphosphatase [Chlamydiae bacterium]|nr:Undecaprenyl-diphosphatase [Chlamydiota bacterium]
MPKLIALILGLVQGLTEFFPISSSAHLKLVKMLMHATEIPVMFDLVCHLGSLGALIWFFRTDIKQLVVFDRKRLSYFFIALLPLIPCYFLLNPVRKFASQPEFLGLFLMLTGGILILGGRVRIKHKRKRSLLRDVLLIGTMQSAALIPGISRSASTISCAQILGWKSKDAVRFSFLLAIPTIIGGNFIEARHLWKKGQITQFLNLECLIGFAAAFFVGLLVIRFAINWLEKGKLKLFAWYCLLIGFGANVYMFLK